MTRPSQLLTLAFLGLCSACGQRATGLAPSRTPSEEAQLLLLEQDMMNAIRTRDRSGLERIVDERFELHMPGQPTLDRAAFIDTLLSIPGTVLAVEPEGVQARAYGDMGVILGQQRARVRLPDGSTVTDLQVFTDIALRRDGQWRLVLAHGVDVPE